MAVYFFKIIQPTKFPQNSSEQALKKFLDSASEAVGTFSLRAYNLFVNFVRLRALFVTFSRGEKK
jgi:hypothetical protein